MNLHDSERISGMLEARGFEASPSIASADVVIFNTCCVREHAEERLRGQVSSAMRDWKPAPETIVAIGGCIGQRDGESLFSELARADIVFGTHNVHELPELIDQVSRTGVPIASVGDCSDGFASDLPSVRDRTWHAWLPITVGCDNHCSYCIVPSVRGRERSRPLEDVLSEAHSLTEDGVVEITLLGQNVNSYGRDLYGSPRFAEALAGVAQSGVRRIRFATSHPKDLTQETIDVIASTPQICDSLHLPIQSGSNRILTAMRRRYTQEDYLRLVDSVYEAIPGIALSTDIMVGFPGETEKDFQETLHVIRESRFDQAFTFIYSPREGTPAARMSDTVDPREIQDRFDRLVIAVNESALTKNLALEDTIQRVLIEGPSKRDPNILAGRSEGNKVVHAPCPEGVQPEALAGTFVDIEIEEAHTWFLTGTLRG